jgi:pre-mRNA-splicing helicase BRR2
MELFDYQSFHITAKFLKNRDVIVWCTKLMRSDADERVNVEVAMREKERGLDTSRISQETARLYL